MRVDNPERAAGIESDHMCDEAYFHRAVRMTKSRLGSERRHMPRTEVRARNRFDNFGMRFLCRGRRRIDLAQFVPQPMQAFAGLRRAKKLWMVGRPCAALGGGGFQLRETRSPFSLRMPRNSRAVRFAGRGLYEFRKRLDSAFRRYF